MTSTGSQCLEQTSYAYTRIKRLVVKMYKHVHSLNYFKYVKTSSGRITKLCGSTVQSNKRKHASQASVLTEWMKYSTIHTVLLDESRGYILLAKYSWSSVQPRKFCPHENTRYTVT